MLALELAFSERDWPSDKSVPVSVLDAEAEGKNLVLDHLLAYPITYGLIQPFPRVLQTMAESDLRCK